MNHKLNACKLACAIAFSGFGAGAHAATIASNNMNHSFAAAQEIGSGYFDTIVNGAIENSTVIPHATVAGFAAAAGNYDYFKFYSSGGSVTLDIDYTYQFTGNPGPFDPEVALWKIDGTYLGENDDGGSLDVGSVHGWDSYLSMSGLSAGWYVVGVASFDALGQDGGWAPASATIPSPGFYTLHISTPVPEPEQWLMFSAGLLALGGIARRRIN